MMFDEGQGKKPKTNVTITFLIGNGFDLGLGLRTRYIDFLDSYLKVDTNVSVLATMKKKIGKDFQSWGDAELAFGKLPFSTFGNDFHSVVKECLADFSDSLSNYLAREENRFIKPDDKLKLAFSIRLLSYYQALGEYAKMDELNRIKRYATLKVNIINFNYTETIDKMLVTSGAIELPELGKVNVQISPICHVHGSLSTKHSRLFGVNTISQVEDSHLSDVSKMLLVKPTIDRMAGCHLESKAKRMIDESDTVIVFGMSMGATDRIWWDYLANHIRNSSEYRRLFLAPYVSCQHGATCLAEEGEWAEIERRRFYDAIEAQKNYYSIENLGENIDVFLRGPYHDPDGQQVFCDPFCLSWFGKKLVSDSQETMPSSGQAGSIADPLSNRWSKNVEDSQ